MALDPTEIDAIRPVDLTPQKNSIESLNHIESPKIRTKLRLYAILAALYVSYLALAPT